MCKINIPRALPEYVHIHFSNVCVMTDVHKPGLHVKVFHLDVPDVHRVQSEEDVEEPKRNHPEHPGWHCVPRANHLQEHPPSGSWLDTTNHHRQTRVWGSGIKCTPEFNRQEKHLNSIKCNSKGIS